MTSDTCSTCAGSIAPRMARKLLKQQPLFTNSAQVGMPLRVLHVAVSATQYDAAVLCVHRYCRVAMDSEASSGAMVDCELLVGKPAS